jgi:hypothetical protein
MAGSLMPRLDSPCRRLTASHLGWLRPPVSTAKQPMSAARAAVHLPQNTQSSADAGVTPTAG